MNEQTSLDTLKADITSERQRTLTEQFLRVMSLVKLLRTECPWDRKQTPGLSRTPPA